MSYAKSKIGQFVSVKLKIDVKMETLTWLGRLNATRE